MVNVDLIKSKKFRVVLDAVNSTGGMLIPQLLEKLGVECVELYCDPNGHFPHNPEPLPENLTEISKKVIDEKANLGIVVDPDVDRLALICEDGSMFGEEYTLVSVADFVLSKTPGNTVSNLSSTRALSDITSKYDCKYYASAVGEVNVVEKMKECNAIIGGEGNGGIIYPSLHYGRDALVGIALFLTNLADRITNSMQKTIDQTNYKRNKQEIYNKQNNITPTPIIKKTENSITEKLNPYKINKEKDNNIEIDIEKMSNKELDQIIKSTKIEMQKMAKSLNFIEAGKLRDNLFKLEAMRAKKSGLN